MKVQCTFYIRRSTFEFKKYYRLRVLYPPPHFPPRIDFEVFRTGHFLTVFCPYMGPLVSQNQNLAIWGVMILL